MTLTEPCRTSNWQYLTRQLTQSVAHRLVEAELERRTPQDLELILCRRRHDPDFETSECEVRVRLDQWLGSAGLLWLAWLCGYITNPAETPESSDLIKILANKAVRRYYEVHSPLAVPWLMRLHLEGAIRLPSAEEAVAPWAFERFVAHFERFKYDSALMQFLDFSFGFGYGVDQDRVDLQTVLDSFTSPERSAIAVCRQSDQLDKLDLGIIGVARFLDHSSDLDDLLARCESQPIIQSAFWFFYASWFPYSKEDSAPRLAEALDRAIKEARSRKILGGEDRLARASEQVLHLNRVLSRLTSGHFARGLLRALFPRRHAPQSRTHSRQGRGRGARLGSLENWHSVFATFDPSWPAAAAPPRTRTVEDQHEEGGWAKPADAEPSAATISAEDAELGVTEED